MYFDVKNKKTNDYLHILSKDIPDFLIDNTYNT